MVKRVLFIVMISVLLLFSCTAKSKEEVIFESFKKEIILASDYVKETPFAETLTLSLDELKNISFEDLIKTKGNERLFIKDDKRLCFIFFDRAVAMKSAGEGWLTKLYFSFEYKNKRVYKAYLTNDENIKLVICFYDEKRQSYVRYRITRGAS